MPSQPNQPPEYPLLHFIMAGVAFAGTYWLFENQTVNTQWFGVAALVTSFMGLVWLVRGFQALLAHAQLRRINREIKEPSTAHGSARWGTARDAKRAGMLGRGYFELGTIEGKRMAKNGEGASVVISPPGGGKTSRLVINQLTQEQYDEHGQPMSIVCLDPTAEIQCVASPFQRSLKRKQISLVSHAARLSDELGVEITDCGFNPYTILNDAGEETKDLAFQLAHTVQPDDPKASGSSKFFNTAAQRFHMFLNLYMTLRGNPSPAEARRLCMSSAEGWDLIFAEAMVSDAFGGTLRELAVRLNDTRASENEWSGMVNTAIQSLECFDDFGPIGRSVSVQGGFDFATLKTGAAKTVYVTLPAEYASSHGVWLNLVLTAAIEQMSRIRTNRKVLLLLDEFASTGLAMPSIFKCVALGRKLGLVPIIYLQSYEQLRAIYGDSRARELLAMCEMVVGLGVRDRETCKMLADLAGSKTAHQTSHSVRPDGFGNRSGPDYSTSTSQHGQRLILPEQVRELPENKALVFYKNSPPFKVMTTPYFRNPRLRRRAAPNPYYRKPSKGG
ncbi:MAG: type IV secretory system conjugative DNA transfer family protein [Phycisphaera sp.]|nr:MAG: type IV secretory system conjugative DNA transfer family protein [Phycisphaera sp.]